MSPDVELAQSITMLLWESEKLRPLLEEGNYRALANALAKIERLARVGSYCIIDIADFG